MRGELKLDLPDPEWLALLRAEVAREGNSIASVARQIGMPRPSLSMLLSGNYPASMDTKARKYAAKILSLFKDQQYCPHTHTGIGMDVCRANAAAPMSTSNPIRLAQWQACRACDHNPENEVQNG